MAEITPEQALLAVKAAGLDPDKPLSEQLHPSTEVSEEKVKGWVTEAVSEAMGAQDTAGQSTDPQVRELRFAEDYRDALNRARTPWMGEDFDDAA
jgi:hypothetical protein